jgi:6-pyruvoyltetrahydropterin/6-carboxytetrahydropterin synthase
MAHTLHGYDGVCRNIHGHSYNLEITIQGEPRRQPGHPKDGMLLDFGELKEIVKNHVVNPFDHALMVSSQVPEEQKQLLRKTSDRFIVVSFQPTSENMVTHIAEILISLLPVGVSLFSVRLFETATSYAEWFATDN